MTEENERPSLRLSIGRRAILKERLKEVTRQRDEVKERLRELERERIRLSVSIRSSMDAVMSNIELIVTRTEGIIMAKVDTGRAVASLLIGSDLSQYLPDTADEALLEECDRLPEAMLDDINSWVAWMREQGLV